jgi:tetratricopeptide (TPR) repeat protein
LTLAGQHVAFAGRLSSLSRREARLLVSRLGGTPVDEITARTTMLVVGAGGAAAPDPPGGKDTEDERTQKTRRAELINEKEPGRIRVISEDELCQLAGIPSPPTLRHQWYALHDILAMYPRLREDHLHYLQKWNLIRPALRTQVETYFAFPDLAVIRQCNAELERGTPFRAALRALQGSRGGQMTFDFSLEAEPAKVIGLRRPAPPPVLDARPSVDTAVAEEHFRDGSALDDGDARKHEAASRAYRRALEVDPCMVPALINLANIHYAREHLIEAEVLYSRAISIQPDVFEAHFNLGNVYHDLGRLDEARLCYEEAISLNDQYPEVHFYLAVTLEKLGRSNQAKPHWRRYRDLAPDGEWVELAREFSE